MSVTKKNIVNEISVRTGLTKVDCEIVIEELFATISRTLIDRNNIEIRGFGSFKLKKRNAHLARNPRNGEKVEIKAGTKPIFQASREFKSRVNKGIPTPKQDQG